MSQKIKKPLSVLSIQIEASGSKCYQHKEPIDRQFRELSLRTIITENYHYEQ